MAAQPAASPVRFSGAGNPSWKNEKITGTPAVGQTLTCGTGTFSTAGDGAFTSSGAIGAPALTYAWTSNGTDVGTASTYEVATGDAQHSIACTVTATGAYGHGSATSSAVSPSACVPWSSSMRGFTNRHPSVLS